MAPRQLAVTADSPSLAARHRQEAIAFAHRFAIPHLLIRTEERRILIGVLLLIGVSGQMTALLAQPPLRTVRQLQQRIEEILRRPEFATTRWGILVESLDRGGCLCNTMRISSSRRPRM